MASNKGITRADIIDATSYQLKEWADALDMAQAVRGGVPDVAEYYREQMQVMRDNMRELAEQMRTDAECAEA